MGAGSTPLGGKKVYVDDGVMFLRSQNVWNDGLRLDDVARILPSTHDDMNGTHIESGDVLLNITGASIGRSAVVPDDFDPANVSQHVAILRLIDKSMRGFLHLCIVSPFFQDTIMRVQVGVSREGLSMTRLREFPVPLPPLAEQHRIVSKVDELMGLCDRLEAVQGERRGVRVRLNRSSLDRLTSSSTARGSGLSAAWQRVCDHFEVLYDTPETLPDLRQTILQLAVQGKLVKQDPSDEPAVVLAERIETTRQELIKSKEIKKPRGEKPLDESILPFEIPPTWNWVKFERLVRKMGAGSTPLGGKKVYVDEGVMFLRSQNVWNDGLRLDDVARILPETHHGMSGTHIEPGDVLLNITGASIGRSAVVPDDFDAANVSQHVAILRLIENSMRDFVHLCIVSPFFQETIMRVQVGVSREGLSMTRLREFPVPIPPLSEQKRIVSKVTHLLSQVTRLESTLTRRESTRTHLLTAAIHAILNGDDR